MNKAGSDKKFKMRRLSALLLALLLALPLLGAAACSGQKAPSPPATEGTVTEATGGQESRPSEADKVKAYDFRLPDQKGDMHTLSDYEGKVVFLNFWATWCPPCKKELPDVEALYKDHKFNEEDLVVLGVVYPGAGSEMDEEGIKAFLNDQNISFPVLMDGTGEVYGQYRITGMPTTFIIDRQGNFVGYVQGALSRELMDLYVGQALEAKD